MRGLQRQQSAGGRGPRAAAVRAPARLRSILGEEVSARLNAPLQGRRRYKGVIQSADGLQVILLADGVTISIPFASIDKANVVPNF